GVDPSGGRLPRHLSRPEHEPSAGAGPLALPVAAVPDRIRRGADKAARGSLLARSHLPLLPPRDAADAEPALVALPQPAPVGAQAGGRGQPRRAVGGAVRAVRP